MTRSKFKNRYVLCTLIEDKWVYKHDAKNWWVVQVYKELCDKKKIQCKILYNGTEVDKEVKDDECTEDAPPASWS